MTKAWVCGRSPAGFAVLNPAGGVAGCLSLVSGVCCQVEVSTTGRSLAQGGPTECDVCVWIWSRNPSYEKAMAHWGDRVTIKIAMFDFPSHQMFKWRFCL
jgi:hypothetical protein